MRGSKGRRSIAAAALVLAAGGCFSSGEEKPEPKNLVKDPTLGELELLQNAKNTYDQGLYSVSHRNWAELRDGYPASYYAPLAELKAADALYYAADFGSAVVTYQEFLRLHPGHEAVPYVRYQIARANFEQYKGISHDQSPLIAAVKAYSDLIEKHGDSDYAVQARRELDRCKELHAEHIALVARFYDKMGLTEASENRLAVLEGKFPASKAARELEVAIQSGKPLPPHDTKEQPRAPLVISEDPAKQTLGAKGREHESGSISAYEKATLPTAGASDLDVQAPAKTEQGAGENPSSGSSGPTSDDSFLAGVICASSSGRVVVTVRTKSPLDPVKLTKDQAKELTITAVEAAHGGLGSARSEHLRATCSAGPVSAVASEERGGIKRSVSLALTALEPMRFYILNQGAPLQVAAVPLNE